MSDDDFLYDEDDNLYFDEFPYIEAVGPSHAADFAHLTSLPR